MYSIYHHVIKSSTITFKYYKRLRPCWKTKAFQLKLSIYFFSSFRFFCFFIVRSYLLTVTTQTNYLQTQLYSLPLNITIRYNSNYWAYFLVHSAANLSCSFLLVLYNFAISGTNGSSIKSQNTIIDKQLHWSTIQSH